MRDDNLEIGTAIRRGLLGRCPNCGKGKLFSGYLGIVPHCAVCAAPLGSYRAADGPAFATTTIIGLLLIPVLGFSYVTFRPDPFLLATVVAVSLTGLTLVMLRVSKGMIIGYLWATNERDHGA